jgi:nucleotide-binding universal stress UspA family protein
MNVLFAYDGSASADAAIAVAPSIIGDRATEVVVLTVWEPLLVQAIRAGKFGSPGLAVPLDVADQDAHMQEHARELAEHGARLAREAGFEARALWISDEHDIPRAIVDAAAELDADLIVMGERGLTGIRSILGSVSRRVVEGSQRPVLVIPPADATETADGVAVSGANA